MAAGGNVPDPNKKPSGKAVPANSGKGSMPKPAPKPAGKKK